MDIIGHVSQIKILKRFADTRAFSHGYLFFGPEGVGKRLVAESLAHYCEGGDFVPASRVLNDSKVIQPDAEGKIGIDAARQIKFFLYDRPNTSAYRVAIIDEAHRLTPEAQNALLKVAEEPPSSGLLIFISSDREGLLPTLQSRLHQIYFGTVPAAKLTKWLIETHGYGEAKAKVASIRAMGSPARALREETSKEMKAAKLFLSAAPSARRELVKKLIAPVDFNLSRFLDGCAETLAEDFDGGTRDYGLWHRVLSLREQAARGSLNARLQLMALVTDN